MLFFGTYAQSVDAKGRVIVPTAFREGLGKDFMIGLNGTANAIAFYPREKWNSILEELLFVVTESHRFAERVESSVVVVSLPCSKTLIVGDVRESAVGVLLSLGEHGVLLEVQENVP